MASAERTVAVRPDGDLTIEGTSVWMPGDLESLNREIGWTVQRLRDLSAGAAFLIAQDFNK